MLLSGQVVKGRGYGEKPVPTANIQLAMPMEAGTFIGVAYEAFDKERLGDCFVFISEHSPDIAETYISGYSGDLYGAFISISETVPLDESDMRFLYDTAMKKWREQNVPAVP